MVTEWELWACANQLVGQHGRRAQLKIAERLLELEVAGDVEGHCTCIPTSERVTKLLREKPAPDEAVH
jgi:hypothetical protein